MVAVKQYLKPVSTTTNKALYIDTKEMPRNCRRLSGMPKTQEQIPPSNGTSRPKLVHINRAKLCNLCLAEKLAILQSNPATTLNKRSELRATNDATKTLSNRKFYYVVLLIECEA